MLDQKLFNLNPDFLTYTLSKIGLQGLTTLLAQAFAPRLRVAGIAPGLTLRSGSQTDARFAEQHADKDRAHRVPRRHTGQFVHSDTGGGDDDADQRGGVLGEHRP